MTSPNQDATEVAEALHSLSETIGQLQAGYAATQRTNRLLKVALIALLLFFVVGAYIGINQALEPVQNVLGQIAHRLHVSPDPEADELQREQLFAQLTPKQREHVERFEQQHKWIANYIRTNPDFDAGAAIALFLSDMSISVSIMPEMYAEVHTMAEEVRDMTQEIKVMTAEIQSMNGKMHALPVLANEVQGIHRQMAVMSGNMDSTMGQAGRMMPWQW